MKVRFTLVLLLTLVVGGAIGYAVGARDEPTEDARTSFSAATPVSAANPRVPVDIFEQDPDDAALEPAVPITQTTLTVLNDSGKPTKQQLVVSVPTGWTQSQANSTRWMFLVPGNDAMSYGLRVEIIADHAQSVDSAIQSRESALRSARLQGSFEDLEITPDDSDGFVAEYVQDGYQRFSVERFYPGPDPDVAYATVAVYGRARDLTGMNDLLERISIDLRPVQRP